jgi:hypothetical protein
VPNHAEHTPNVGQDAAAHARMEPATSLPWATEWDDNGFHYIYANGGAYRVIAVTDRDGETADADAAYIVSAANAYQRLVRVVREVAVYDPRQLNCTSLDVAVRHINNLAAALLRELGEA